MLVRVLGLNRPRTLRHPRTLRLASPRRGFATIQPQMPTRQSRVVLRVDEVGLRRELRQPAHAAARSVSSSSRGLVAAPDGRGVRGDDRRHRLLRRSDFVEAAVGYVVDEAADVVLEFHERALL